MKTAVSVTSTYITPSHTFRVRVLPCPASRDVLHCDLLCGIVWGVRLRAAVHGDRAEIRGMCEIARESRGASANFGEGSGGERGTLVPRRSHRGFVTAQVIRRLSVLMCSCVLFIHCGYAGYTLCIC